MDIFVFGIGGHAKVVTDVIEATGSQRIAGYVVAEPEEDRFLGRELFEEARFIESRRGVAVALAVGDNGTRRSLSETLGEGFSFPAIVHPSATLSPSARIGAGTVVMPGAIVNAQAEVGRFCVLNSGVIVEHECRIDDFVSVAPNACVCGACRLEEGCYVGAGATVIQGLRLGRWSTVGAGAVVCADVAEGSTVMGVPAMPKLPS